MKCAAFLPSAMLRLAPVPRGVNYRRGFDYLPAFPTMADNADGKSQRRITLPCTERTPPGHAESYLYGSDHYFSPWSAAPLDIGFAPST